MNHKLDNYLKVAVCVVTTLMFMALLASLACVYATP